MSLRTRRPEYTKESMQTRMYCLLVCIAASSNNLVADEFDFRSQWAIPSVWLFESPQIRQELKLTDQQSEQINGLIKEWKAIVLKARKDHETSSHLPGSRTRTGRNRIPITSVRKAIRKHLTAEQLPRFDQMILLWNFSPVQSGDAIRFGELELSVDQLRELYALNITWVLHGLKELDYSFRSQRSDTQVTAVRRDFSKWRTYMEDQTRLAWQFKSDRDVEWSRILTPAQASRWKELELQKTFGLDPFAVLVTDYSLREKGQIPRTGKSSDYVVPYFTPPASVLKLCDEQKQRIQKLIAEFNDQEKIPRGRSSEERQAWIEAMARRQQHYMDLIEAELADQQRTALRSLFGEPGEPAFFKTWAKIWAADD